MPVEKPEKCPGSEAWHYRGYTIERTYLSPVYRTQCRSPQGYVIRNAPRRAGVIGVRDQWEPNLRSAAEAIDRWVDAR